MKLLLILFINLNHFFNPINPQESALPSNEFVGWELLHNQNGLTVYYQLTECSPYQYGSMNGRKLLFLRIINGNAAPTNYNFKIDAFENGNGSVIETFLCNKNLNGSSTVEGNCSMEPRSSQLVHFLEHKYTNLKLKLTIL
ncbi:MAG: hypothetical protein IT267_00415 [Saprospiraceae bacterium]|nr:hypothetical protein [Saprospiraceae bacterium]